MSEQDGRINQKIVEDTPHLRSVSMMSSQPTTIQHDLQSTFAKPSSGVSLLPDTSAQPKGRGESKSSGPPSRSNTNVWNVSSLMSIPPYYQLERTHVYIAPDVTLFSLTSRIMDVMRNESIAAVYDDEEVCIEY